MGKPYSMLIFVFVGAACQAEDVRDAGVRREARADVATRAEDVGGDPASFALSAFAEPPRTHAPGVRWIWPGGAVDDAIIEREVARIADAGYGAIELQTLVTALSEAEVAAVPRIRSVGEPAFLGHVRTLARAARAHGLAYDLTLGSGWPSGGVGVPPAAQEQQIIWSRVDVTGPAQLDLELPAPAPASWVEAPVTQLLTELGMLIAAAPDPAPRLQAVVAAPILDTAAVPPVLGAAFEVGEHVQDGRLRWQVPSGAHALFALYQGRTAHVVLGAAFPGAAGDARVIDHLDPGGVRWVIEAQLRPLLRELGPERPRQLFIDSPELAGELPWTESLRQRVPYRDVPFLLRAGGETKYAEVLNASATPAFAAHDALHAERAREEYELARAEAFQRSYLAPLLSAAHELDVSMRVQAHGGWGALLDDYASVDVPESETLFAGGSFDFLNLAASAAHVAGHARTSLESFVTLNLLGPAALDQDALWQLAGHAFSAGINQLVHSVVVYPYRHADGAPWYPLATFTSQIEPGSDAWAFLPAFNRAQARICYALSRGTPRVDIAWLKSERAQWDSMVIAAGGLNTIGEESAQSQALRAAGFTYDRVSPNMLARAEARGGRLQVGAASYRALLVDAARVVEPELLERLQVLRAAGVPVVWVGEAPARAPGLRDAQARDARVAAAWSRLGGGVLRVAAASEVAGALRDAGVSAELAAVGPLGRIGLLQRDTDQGRLIWFFNESALPQLLRAKVRTAAARGLWLDPETGGAREVALEAEADGAGFWLALAGLRGGLLLLREQNDG